MTIRRQVGILGAALLFSVAAVPMLFAQGQEAGPSPSETGPGKHKTSLKAEAPSEVDAGTKASEGSRMGLMGRFQGDQREIWTSPARIRFSDTEWLVPLSGITAGLFVTDHDFSKHLSQNPTTTSHYKTLSNAGVAALVGGAGGMWLLGHASHNEHWSETGFLAGEAALNSFVAVEGLKYSLRRERPYQGNGSGSFFQRGGTSFPSEHAAAAWSVAGVIAHEYPGPLTKIIAYGLASLVDISRVRAQQHFPSDVVVGAVIGNLVAQNIYSRHHDPDLGGGEWRSISQIFRGDGTHSQGNQGSPYIPLDSWVYPALERLAARSLVHTQFLGMRPWTRIECAHLVEEAGEEIRADDSVPEVANELYTALEREFRADLDTVGEGSKRSVRLESVYAGVTNISGPPLHDSYHFGQTIINNYGRPYEEGFNTYDGFSGYGTAGRFTVYVRGEYQHAPSAPAYPLAARQVIAAVDNNPLQPAVPFATTDRFTLLDTYMSAQVANWDLSFGKQSLWWGPAEGGAFLFSDNAEPIYMFRASKSAPFQLPWIFSKLGPMKLDLFFGKLSENEFPPRPLIHGSKLSFKPTPNLEIGITATSELSGVGRPLTLSALLRSYFSTGSSDTYPANANPGKRTAGFEFSYRLPHARNWLTVYADGLLPEDNPTNRDLSTSPLYLYRRIALRPGIYMSRVPGLSRLDFRVEAVYTDPPTPRSRYGNYIYYNNFYHDLYTNKNNLIGDWIGRQGMGFQGWSTYWFSPRNSLAFGYRHAKVASDFIPGGETMNDGSVKVSWQLRDDLSVSAGVQYEKWLAPILAPTAQSNWTSSVSVTFWPRSWSK